MDLLVSRISDRYQARAGKKGRGSDSIDMMDENNLATMEMMLPGVVDFGK